MTMPEPVLVGELLPAEPKRRKPHVRQLDRPGNRVRLIADLAAGMRVEEAGEKYGVTSGAITLFRQRWQLEIAEQQADLENKFAALWIADKRARLASMQDDVEKLDREIVTLRREVAALKLDGGEDAAYALAAARSALAASRKAKTDLLRLAGQELGAHKVAVDLNVTTVKYEIVGVETDALR